jgi:uncharacterized protein YqgV (UPF0045/DUF77 family)
MFGQRRKIKVIQAQLDEMMATLKMYSDAAILMDVQRVGSVNRFTFQRGEKTTVIETYGAIGDNLPQWKKELLR